MNKHQKGLAVVEATIVLPLLLLLMLAVGEFGRALYQYSMLSKAMRAGALSIERDGGFYSNSALRAQREDDAKNLIVYGNKSAAGNSVLPGLTTSDVTIVTDYEYPFGSGNYYTELKVEYDWTPVFGDSFNTFFGNSISLNFPMKTSMVVRVM